MLKTWGLRNFKSIYKAELDLAPLTVLTGTNSSGKSAFIQSILLIAQTIRNDYYGYPLVLNGSYVELGQFSNIISFQQDEDGKQIFDPVGIDFSCEFKSGLSRNKIPDNKLTRINFKIEFEASHDGNSTSDNISYRREQFSPRVKNVEQTIDSMNYSGESHSIKKCNFSNITYQYESPDLPMTNIKLEHFWPLINLATGVSDNDDYDDDYPWYNEFNRYFYLMFKYLGPLRHHDSLYPISKEAHITDVGVKGEYTASVIDTCLNLPARYIPINCINNIGLDKGIVVRSLNEALKYWLNYLGIADNVKSELTKHGYQLKSITGNLNEKELNVNLYHVGTGVSQVLPILVSCLLAQKDSILVFEQPELHLHPRIQSRLADFFLSMALVGKQCIIETHSEYFIDKLRLRISQSLLGNNKNIKNNAKIYYFMKDEFKTKINEIEINEYADYNIWPDAFFDERQYINDEILNSINQILYKEKSNDLETESMINDIKKLEVYEEDIYLEETRKTHKYFFFDNLTFNDYNFTNVRKIYSILPEELEWFFCSNPPRIVKELMIKHNVCYSMTYNLEVNKRIIIIIYKHIGNEWYRCRFEDVLEVKGFDELLDENNKENNTEEIDD